MGAAYCALLPYVGRHKGEVLIGMVTQIGMGITGTLLPLIIGAIVDCIKGAAAPLGTTRPADADLAGLPAALLPSQECPDHRRVLFGADHHLRDPGSLFVLDAANSDRAFAGHRIRPAE